MTDLEIMQRAKMYMEKLAQGIDPTTDREVPEDSVLNNVRLARCFFYVSNVLQQVIDNGGEVKRVTGALDFFVTPEQLAAVATYPGNVGISQLVDAINTVAENPQMKKLTATTITNWLLAKGFLEKQTSADGKTRRVPTENGIQLGISTEYRAGVHGPYLAVLYNPQAQQFILDNLPAILEEKS